MAASCSLSIAELPERFPAFRAALVVADGIEIPAAAPPALESWITGTAAEATAALGQQELGSLPELKCWRDAYKAFGEKKTSYRSSVERLLKSLQRGNGLPRVNAFVDAYNAISIRYRMPVGADDLDLVTSPLAFRIARPGDSFIALGDASGADDPPKPGEVVYADAKKCLCRRWNWYQDARSAIRPTTRRAVLTIQSNSPVTAGQVEAAAEDLCRWHTETCGGRAAWRLVDAAKPEITVTA
ncbi:MAG TPA: phenylalanine--tRNA ligase beta subunit-related protein [Dongiaceae bacterium]